MGVTEEMVERRCMEVLHTFHNLRRPDIARNILLQPFFPPDAPRTTRVFEKKHDSNPSNNLFGYFEDPPPGTPGPHSTCIEDVLEELLKTREGVKSLEDGGMAMGIRITPRDSGPDTVLQV